MKESSRIRQDVSNIQSTSVQPASCSSSLPLLTPNKLRQLLEQSAYGKQVIQNGVTHSLSESGRKLVVDIVARYHLALNRKTSCEAVSDLSDVITEVFQKETKVKISPLIISHECFLNFIPW